MNGHPNGPDEIRRTDRNLPNCYRYVSKGLSLFEIMVAICIVSIVTGLATVSLRPLWEKHELRLAVDDLTGRIQLLRMKAILEKSTYQMKIEGPQLFYRRKIADRWDPWTNHRLKERIRYSMSGSSYFSGKGFATPKTITLTNNDYNRKIIININGRSRTSEIF
ncbi:MAG: hypothetical protein GY866_25905 [Proteobacteria bacterium]|nr:hypothetical protein [Pseudomonadota bacterium]